MKTARLKPKKKASSTNVTEIIFSAIRKAIRDLPNPQAIEVLDRVCDHAEEKAWQLRQEEGY